MESYKACGRTAFEVIYICKHFMLTDREGYGKAWYLLYQMIPIVLGEKRGC